jgi:methylated-DNA-[protein]-cysteine S-methyltransferase
MEHGCVYTSPAGKLRISCTDNAVRSVSFQDDNRPTNGEQHPLLTECTRQLDAYFNGTLQKFDLPLEHIGTPFQQKVWQLLLQIPFGKTISYQTLSLQYGDSKAIRAVASANGQNRLAIIVPCHRVIGTNGTLTGYAGGLPRKKWLLDHETKIAAGVQQMMMQW